MDQRSRKLMTMHKALHTRDDVNRLPKYWTLPFRQTKEYNWKKATGERSTWTLLENSKTIEHEDDSDTNWY